jgi:hypothetical protein
MTFKTRSKFVHLALDFLPHVFSALVKANRDYDQSPSVNNGGD